MQHSTVATPTAGVRIWTGRVLSTLAILFMIFDGVLHLLAPEPVVRAFADLGVPLHLSLGIGVIELVCIALYTFSRTSFTGALLLTAYLGGATAIQLRAEAALFPLFFPAVIALLAWGGLALRDERLLSFILRRP
jgi:hypothetical protein